MGLVYHSKTEIQRFANVVQSNDFILSESFHLTAQQAKIMLYLVSKVSSFDDCFKLFSFSAGEFCKTCGIQKGGKSSKEVLNALEGLAQKTKQIKRSDGKIEVIQLLNRIIYDQKEHTVTVSLHESLSEYLLNLKRNFTSYELIWALSLKSKYAIKLYEVAVCVQFNKMENYKRYFAKDELCCILGCETYANRWNAIEQRVLQPARDEINDCTNMIVNYEPVCVNGLTIGINLDVSRKPTVDGMALMYKQSAAMDERLN